MDFNVRIRDISGDRTKEINRDYETNRPTTTKLLVRRV